MTGGLVLAKNSTGGDNNWSTTSDWSGSGSDYVHADAHCFAYHPTDPELVYAGTDGGIFVTKNHGDTWEDLSDGLRIAQIYRISTGQAADDRVLGGWQDNGSNLWNGIEWEEIDASTYDGMEAIIDFTDPDIMFITHQYGDLKRTTNGGDTWTYEQCCGGWVTPFVMDPTDHNIIYYGASAGDVYKSTNNGTSFTNKNSNLSGGEVYSIALTPADPEVVYAATFTDIKRSDNGGTSWTSVNDAFIPGGVALNYLAVSDTDPLKVWAALSAYAEGEKVYYSDNGGESWTNISGTLPNVPVNCIVYEYGSDDRLYIGTDIGVFTKDNSSADWEPYMYGLPNVMIHELEINYTRQKLVAATYGRGVWESDLYDADMPMNTLTAAVSDLSYCPHASIDINYTAEGYFSIYNTFTAQLSDASGGFATPVNIGSVSSYELTGTIPCILPETTLSDSYRVRVVASSPLWTGTDNGLDISIKCDQITDLTTETIEITSAFLSWEASDCSVSYLLNYKESASADWTVVSTTETSYLLSGLLPDTDYEWMVQALCDTAGSAVSTDSETSAFTTLQSVAITEAQLIEQTFTVTPNPVVSISMINFSLQHAAPVSLSLTDINGKLIIHLLQETELSAGSHSIELNISELTSGNYIIELKKGESVFTRSISVQ
jgi:photosystem II stability/assembly factor-like uncharacterized protein